MSERATDPLLAVIAPPRVSRFRERAGLAEDEPLRADFTGWCKRVVLSRDRAFLFPRDHTQVRALQQEVEALRTVEGLGLAEVPRVLDVWDDPDLSPYPVIVLNRLHGSMLDQHVRALTTDELAGALEQVARLAARWHDADPGPLAMSCAAGSGAPTPPPGGTRTSSRAPSPRSGPWCRPPAGPTAPTSAPTSRARETTRWRSPTRRWPRSPSIETSADGGRACAGALDCWGSG